MYDSYFVNTRNSLSLSTPQPIDFSPLAFVPPRTWLAALACSARTHTIEDEGQGVADKRTRGHVDGRQRHVFKKSSEGWDSARGHRGQAPVWDGLMTPLLQENIWSAGCYRCTSTTAVVGLPQEMTGKSRHFARRTQQAADEHRLDEFVRKKQKDHPSVARQQQRMKNKVAPASTRGNSLN